MSQENVEIVRTLFEVWNTGDMDAFRELLVPDVILRNPEGWPEPGPHVGREAVMRQFEQLRETWDTDALELISDFFDVGDRVAVRFVWHAAGHGPQANMELTGVYTVRKGKLLAIENSWDHPEALEISGLSEQAMSQENVEVVKRAVAAVNARDIDLYLGCCTEDIELHVVAFAAVGGVYIGRDAIQRFWTDIADTAPDFRLEIERLEQIAVDQVLASMRVSATGRASGLSVADESPGTNVYDFAGGKIRRVRIFRDRREAFEAVGLSEQDVHADS